MPNSIVKEPSKKETLVACIYWLCPNTRGKRLGISEGFFQRNWLSHEPNV
jgi:hypothetical protein